LEIDNGEYKIKNTQHFHCPHVGSGDPGIGSLPVSFIQIQAPGYSFKVQ
jgi:hypothetical protein